MLLSRFKSENHVLKLDKLMTSENFEAINFISAFIINYTKFVLHGISDSFTNYSFACLIKQYFYYYLSLLLNCPKM